MVHNVHSDVTKDGPYSSGETNGECGVVFLIAVTHLHTVARTSSTSKGPHTAYVQARPRNRIDRHSRFVERDR